MIGVTVEWLSGASDLEQVLEVDRLSFTNPWTRAMYESDLQNTGVSFIGVLRIPECLVAGYCAFWLVADELHINNVAVRPEFRRRGFGRRLVEFALGAGERQGAGRVLLEVRRSNEGARRLYADMGFAELAVRPAYYSNPIEDALVLARDIRLLESDSDT